MPSPRQSPNALEQLDTAQFEARKLLALEITNFCSHVFNLARLEPSPPARGGRAFRDMLARILMAIAMDQCCSNAIDAYDLSIVEARNVSVVSLLELLERLTTRSKHDELRSQLNQGDMISAVCFTAVKSAITNITQTELAYLWQGGEALVRDCREKGGLQRTLS